MTLAMQEEIVDAEIVPSKIEALASIERAIEHAEGFWAEVLWQVENEVWSLLGYSDFDELWAERYSALGVRIDRRERPELVRALRGIGQTNEEVATKLGVNERTVRRDFSTGQMSDSGRIIEGLGYMVGAVPGVTVRRLVSKLRTTSAGNIIADVDFLADIHKRPKNKTMVDVLVALYNKGLKKDQQVAAPE